MTVADILPAKAIAKVADVAKSKFGRKALVLAKRKPKLMLAGGLLLIGAGTVLACKSTLDAQWTVMELRDDLDMIETEVNPETDPKEKAKEKAAAFGRCALDIAKSYAAPVAAIAGGTALVLGSHNEMEGRVAAYAAAYATVSEAFGGYRKRVIDEHGEEADRKYRLGIFDDEIVEEKTLKNGKVKEVKRVVESVHADGMPYSPYARYFDQFNTNMHVRNNGENYDFLRMQENFANEKFQRDGFLFLNDVYEQLGFDKIPDGQLVGWLKGVGDDYIDFGLLEARNRDARDYRNGKESCFVLDFNLDGVIWDKI